MPLILPQKHYEPPRPGGRRSGIPLPLGSGVSHASKPSTNTVLSTPSNKNLASARRGASLSQSSKMEDLNVCEPEVPFLELVPFGRQPTLNFGDVEVGSTKIKHVGIRNIESTQKQVYVKSFPKGDKGFDIEATEFLLAPRSQILIKVAWTPSSVSSVRDTITLQDMSRLSSRVIMIGRSFRPEQRTTTRTSRFTTRLQAKRHAVTPRASPSKLGPKLPLTRLNISSQRRQSAQIVSLINMPQKRLQAAVIIQTHWRRYQAVKRFNQLRDATIIIQKHLRRALAERELRKLIALQRTLEKSAVCIQTCWRSYTAMKRYNKLKQSTITIQKHLRRVLAERELKRMKDQQVVLRKSAICIQTCWRRYIAAKKFYRLRKAAVIIQAHRRRILAKRRLALLKAQHEALERSAICIQSHWRRSIALKRYNKLKASTIIIQKNLRRALAERELSDLKAQRRAQENSAVRIQSCWRTYVAMTRYNKLRESTVIIQKHFRGVLARRELSRLRVRRQTLEKSAIRIQTNWRRTIASKRFNELRHAAIVIQTYRRSVLAKRKLNYLKCRRRFMQDMIVFIQPYCRGFLFRSRLDRSIKAIQHLRKLVNESS